MKRCLELATEAKSRGKTAVGSLIVKNDVIIAEGIEGAPDLPGIMSHAENIAILKAIDQLGTRNLESCRLYTTVEPCFMCSYLIRQTRITKVIYGTKTPAGGDTSAYPILRAENIAVWGHPPEIIGGILQADCEKLLQK